MPRCGAQISARTERGRSPWRAFSIGVVALTCCGCSERLIESAGLGHGDGGADAAKGVSSTGPKCGPAPRQLVDFNALVSKALGGSIGAMQLAVDATNVYFVFDGSLMRVPLRGGPPVVMQSLARVIQENDVVVTSTAVLLHGIVGLGSNDQVLRVPLDGGPTTTLATTNGQVKAFVANESAVYFGDQDGVKTVPVAGGNVQTLTDAMSGSVSGLAIAGANLIVTTANFIANDGAVFSVPLGGGAPTELAAQQSSASFPMVCGSDVCWWTGAPPTPMGPTGPGYIARLENGAVTTISAPVFPWSLAFDGWSFFETVGCDACSGTLVRIPASGAPVTSMVTAGYAAVDEDCVYFSVADGIDLPSSVDGGIPGAGIFSVAKSYADPVLPAPSELGLRPWEGSKSLSSW